MRSDAARRRSAIVRAARREFSVHGSGVALDQVADAAGVGIATLYRNFASRAALADEVALAILADVRAAGEEAMQQLGEDAEVAWNTYVRGLVDLDLGALSAALADHLAEGMSEPVRAAQADTLAGIGDLLAVVRDIGLVRRDLEPLELVLGVGLVSRPLPEAVAQDAPDLMPRMVDILLAGMRPQLRAVEHDGHFDC